MPDVNKSPCPLALLKDFDKKYEEATELETKLHLERRRNEVIEDHSDGWWCVLRLEDRQPYIEGQNKIYDDIA
eukprot:4648105-Karenia_brevis.AAC.1